MTRTVLNARLHLFGLMLVWAGWMFMTGLLAVRLLGAALAPIHFDQGLAVAFSLLVSAAAWVMLNSRLPELARRGNLWTVRVVGLSGAIGAASFVLGAAATRPEPLGGWLFTAGSDANFFGLRIALGIVGFFLLALAPSGECNPAPFFLTNRFHASDEIARRSLAAAAVHALLLAIACDLALHHPVQTGELEHFPHMLWLAAIAYIAGVVASMWQRYPQRAVGMLPVGCAIAVIALFANWLAPTAQWPIMLLGFGFGLGHTPPRNDLLANVEPGQRVAGLALMAVAQAAGAAFGIELISAISGGNLAPLIRFVIVLIAAVAATNIYLRELFESIIELILMVTNPIRGCGPGLKVLPTRGPVLVLANHSSWFDPLWLSKVIPLRLRPMMTSRFYDLPVISWLMRKAFRAIRVVDAAYRRETPEIQEVIAALDAGENVLIFPEGWLRRRDDQSVRRFGQGVYQILRELPRTPVVVCWIEGGWGSYTSFWHGPPTINKKPDFLRRIRIGVSEPKVLSLEMLHNHLQTRRYLMQVCLHARTYIGLPELPPPPMALDDDAEDKPA